MKFQDFKNRLPENIFTITDVKKVFRQESAQLIKVQLARFIKKNLIIKIKKGVYCFQPKLIDEFELANQLYQPSYLSLETALHYYSLIPDIPQAVTSVTLTTTKIIRNQFGVFYYSKIKHALFWGYTWIQLPQKLSWVMMAEREKALLDFFYIRKIKNTADLRIDVSQLDNSKLQKYANYYPPSVHDIKL